MERTQSRPKDTHWYDFKEGTREINDVTYPIYKMTAGDNLVDGLFYLYSRMIFRPSTIFIFYVATNTSFWKTSPTRCSGF